MSNSLGITFPLVINNKDYKETPCTKRTFVETEIMSFDKLRQEAMKEDYLLA